MKVNVVVTCTMMLVMLLVVNPLVSMGDTYKKSSAGSKEIIAMILSQAQQKQPHKALQSVVSSPELGDAWSAVQSPREEQAADRHGVNSPSPVKRHDVTSPSPKKRECHSLNSPSPKKVLSSIASTASLSESDRANSEISLDASFSERNLLKRMNHQTSPLLPLTCDRRNSWNVRR